MLLKWSEFLNTKLGRVQPSEVTSSHVFLSKISLHLFAHQFTSMDETLVFLSKHSLSHGSVGLMLDLSLSHNVHGFLILFNSQFLTVFIYK